jgi:hypothetical protein
MEREETKDGCWTPPNSRLFWDAQFAKFVDDWAAYKLIEIRKYRG